jgi:Asp/Glu/hydantoin racemase
MTWTLLAATIDSLDELRKCLKSAFCCHARPELLDAAVDSTKSVSAELSESEIKSA